LQTGRGAVLLECEKNVSAARLPKPLPLCLKKLSQPGRIRAELVPCRSELPHAVLSILAYALRVDLAHGDHAIDAPSPMLGGTNPVLYADRSDLDLEAVVLEEDAVISIAWGWITLRRYKSISWHQDRGGG
jgi:hypothetical protein